MKERLYYILMNILEKLETSINVERITDNEIDTLFGSASGTGTDAQDYVIEHGASGGWTYRKWASGISEAWYSGSVTLSLQTAWGSVYFSGSNTNFSIPNSVFNSTPTVLATVGNNSHMMGMSLTNNTNASNVNGYIWASRQEANLSIMVRLYCFGTWK